MWRYITQSSSVVFVGFIGILITFLVSSKPTKEFSLAFKKMFVLKALKSIFTNLNYENQLQALVIFEKSGII